MNAEGIILFLQIRNAIGPGGRGFLGGIGVERDRQAQGGPAGAGHAPGGGGRCAGRVIFAACWGVVRGLGIG